MMQLPAELKLYFCLFIFENDIYVCYGVDIAVTELTFTIPELTLTVFLTNCLVFNNTTQFTAESMIIKFLNTFVCTFTCFLW
jgi:hypothetical protein